MSSISLSTLILPATGSKVVGQTSTSDTYVYVSNSTSPSITITNNTFNNAVPSSTLTQLATPYSAQDNPLGTNCEHTINRTGKWVISLQTAWDSYTGAITTGGYFAVNLVFTSATSGVTLPALVDSISSTSFGRNHTFGGKIFLQKGDKVKFTASCFNNGSATSDTVKVYPRVFSISYDGL